MEFLIRYAKLGYQIFYLSFVSLFSFSFFFQSLYGGLRARIRVISQSCCHTSVTLDDTVIVIVTKS